MCKKPACVVSWLVTSVCHLVYIAGLQTPSENLLLFDLGGFAVQTERCLRSLQLPLPKLEIAGNFLAGTSESLHAVGTDFSELLVLQRPSLKKKREQYVNK